MENLPYIVTIQAEPPPSVYPLGGDTIPPFVEIEADLRSLRADLLRAMPSYLNFKAEPDARRIAIDYDWLLDFCALLRRPFREALFARIQSATDLVTAHIDAHEFEQFLGQMITASSLIGVAAHLRDQDMRRQYEGRPGYVALLKHGMGLKSVLSSQSIHWRISVSEITAERFASAVGRAPEDDDLDRCNCQDAGKIGHSGCGWCSQCDRPRFICGHLLAALGTSQG